MISLIWFHKNNIKYKKVFHTTKRPNAEKCWVKKGLTRGSGYSDKSQLCQMMQIDSPKIEMMGWSLLLRSIWFIGQSWIFHNLCKKHEDYGYWCFLIRYFLCIKNCILNIHHFLIQPFLSFLLHFTHRAVEFMGLQENISKAKKWFCIIHNWLNKLIFGLACTWCLESANSWATKNVYIFQRTAIKT